MLLTARGAGKKIPEILTFHRTNEPPSCREEEKSTHYWKVENGGEWGKYNNQSGINTIMKKRHWKIINDIMDHVLFASFFVPVYQHVVFFFSILLLRQRLIAVGICACCDCIASNGWRKKRCYGIDNQKNAACFVCQLERK